jgi:hypothetical protein
MTSNCNWIKIRKVYVFGQVFSVLFTHYQFITSRTCKKPDKKLANMPAKRKCKEVIARERSKSANENAAEDQSCTMHEDTSNVEGHAHIQFRVSHLSTYCQLQLYNLSGKRIRGYNMFCYISRSHFNIFLKNLWQSRDLQPLNINQ